MKLLHWLGQLGRRGPPAPEKGSKEAIELAKQKSSRDSLGSHTQGRGTAPHPTKPLPKKEVGQKKKGQEEGGKKRVAKEGGGKRQTVEGREAVETKNSADDESCRQFHSPPSEQPFRTRRPMSSQGRRTCARSNRSSRPSHAGICRYPAPAQCWRMHWACRRDPYSECIASLPLPGASFLSVLQLSARPESTLYERPEGQDGGGRRRKEGEEEEKK